LTIVPKLYYIVKKWKNYFLIEKLLLANWEGNKLVKYVPEFLGRAQ
jgi:hypothetical protein